MTAPSIAADEVTPVQELYRAEKARKVARDAPVLAAAAAELQRQADEAREARKGGRPKGRGFEFGGRRFARKRSSEPESEMPGRPERLELHPGSTTTRAEPSMSATKTWKKTCTRSGAAFDATGPAAKYCGKCDECRAASAETKSPPRETKAPKHETKKRKVKRVNTGFRSEIPRRAAPPPETDSLYQRRLTEIEGELATYEQLMVERDALQQLIQTVDGAPRSNGNGRKKARR